MPTEGRFRVIALIASYNEGDIIADVVGDLINQGILVYLLDHRSSDDTVARVQPLLGHGLIDIEQFPADDDESRESFTWERILKRKETLAQELDADWFIHHDADEFRESPWQHLTLSEAIQAVDRFGYNAIDFQVFNFRPTGDAVQSVGDVREALRFYEPADPFDKLQIKCWKKTAATVDLVSSAGHDVEFADRRIFPLRFILRHYPIRSQEHGERKVFSERRGRFVAAEREKGWHIQYDDWHEGDSFVHDPATLALYDPDVARLELALRHRGVEELETGVEKLKTGVGELETRLAENRRSADALAQTLKTTRQDLQTTLEALATTQTEVAQLSQQREELRAAVELARSEADRMTHDISDTRHHLQAMIASASWRWTAPLRAMHRWLTRFGR